MTRRLIILAAFAAAFAFGLPRRAAPPVDYLKVKNDVEELRRFFPPWLLRELFMVDVLGGSVVEARPAKPRPPGGDVRLTISTREQLIVLAVFNSLNPQATSYEKLRGLMTLDQALGLDEARAWSAEWLKAHAKDVDALRKEGKEVILPAVAPDDPKPKLLTRVETAALIDLLDIKPTKEQPVALFAGRIIFDVRDAAKDALAAMQAARAAPPVATKVPGRIKTP